MSLIAVSSGSGAGGGGQTHFVPHMSAADVWVRLGLAIAALEEA